MTATIPTTAEDLRPLNTMIWRDLTEAGRLEVHQHDATRMRNRRRFFLCSCGLVAAQYNGMDPRLSVFAGINIIGAVQAACLGVVLLTWRRYNLQANRLLGALALVLAVFIAGAVLTTTRYYLVWPHLTLIHDPGTFAIAPLMYLYLQTLRTRGGMRCISSLPWRAPRTWRRISCNRGRQSWYTCAAATGPGTT
jgi:hypothetical protein